MVSVWSLPRMRFGDINIENRIYSIFTKDHLLKTSEK